MSTKSEFRRSRATIKEFDGVHNDPNDHGSQNASSGDSDTSVHSENSNNIELVKREDSDAMAEYASNMSPVHLLVVSMLENLCSVYVQEPGKSRQVFKVLHKELVRLKILTPLGGIDELSSMRSQYKVGFAKLVKSAIDVVCDDNIPVAHFPDGINGPFGQPKDLVRSHQRLSLPDLLGFQSRYQEEFVEHGHLGRGAYGSVYECEHKLDGCRYAVKKIAFQDLKPDLWMKVLREVKYLAGLNHKYVVRYHGAWLEYHSPVSKFETIHSRNLPAVMNNNEDSEWSQSREAATQDGEDDDSFIVFDRSGASHRSVKDGQLYNMVDLSEDSSSGVRPSSTVTSGSISQIQTPLVLLHIQMQLCDRTLKEWISTRNYVDDQYTDVYNLIDENQNQIILKQILKGLSYIHTQNLIHRDLKPINIFLMKTGSGAIHAKVGDFGLARHVDTPEVPLTPHPGRTRPCYGESMYTTGVGTTIYASPEQLEGSHYTSKSDMFSLGMILFELYQPFKTESERYSLLNDARKGELPEAFCTRWLSQASYLKLLLHTDPDLRPTAAEFLLSEFFLSKDQVMEKLHTNAAEQSAVIKNQKETIKELHMQIAALNVQLHQKDQLLAVKDRQLLEKTQLLESLSKEL